MAIVAKVVEVKKKMDATRRLIIPRVLTPMIRDVVPSQCY